MTMLMSWIHWLGYQIVFLIIGLGIWSCLMMVAPYTSILVTNVFSGSLRYCTSGLQWIWPWERIVTNSKVAMEVSNYTFQKDFRTKDEVVVSLKITFDMEPDEKHLLEYRRFDAKTRLNGIIERIAGALTIEIRKLKDREEVMDNLLRLAAEIRLSFERLSSNNSESYYGIRLKNLMVYEVDLPSELKDAATQREVMQKINFTRQLEMEKLNQLAGTLVEESEKRGSIITFEKAVEILQLQFNQKNVRKDIHAFQLDKGVQEALRTVLQKVLNAG